MKVLSRSFFAPLAVWLAAVLVLVPVAGRAELLVVANENKIHLVDGELQVNSRPLPDNITIIDLSGPEPRVTAIVERVPVSVIGPPLSVAVTPDEGLALVSAANKIDPTDPHRQIPDNRLSVINLSSAPPLVIATLETGLSPSGVSINRAGNLALVANRSEGTVSVFAIAGKTVSSLGKVAVADAAAGVNHAAFTPDGKRALVTRDGDSLITVLNIDGSKVTLDGRDIHSGFKPYGVAISRDGSFALVSNVGFPDGDTDTIGVIDLRDDQARAVDIVSVGGSPETVRISPDGTLCAAVLINHSNRPKDSPFYSPRGRLLLLRIEGMKLSQVAEADLGGWPQGVAFSADSGTILASSMIEQEIQVFHWDGTTLHDTGRSIKMKGGPAALRTTER